MIDTIISFNKILQAFKIQAECVKINHHRHFAYYDVKLEPGVKVNVLTQYSKEIALALHSTTIPIIKLIPVEGIVRLQVTFGHPEILLLQDLFSKGNVPAGTLPFCLGETDEGNIFWTDMAKNPHMLIAGTTGSGKSVLLHNLIANASKAKNVKVFLVDTKKVEFGIYDNPKCKKLISNVAKDYISATNTIEYLCDMMEARYSYMSSIGVSNIEACTHMLDKILVIIDEVADLIMMDKSEKFQNALIKLAAKSRAAGIYIVLATQRPSVDIITGAIKANFPARLACKVSSRVDSQVILDEQGAESLFGKGEALFKNPYHDLTRLQIAYVNPLDTIKTL
jgi:S-DNA-T family DNA segregation ATPase FtsK/SpoIIIE